MVRISVLDYLSCLEAGPSECVSVVRDCLHRSIIAQHRGWSERFARLKTSRLSDSDVGRNKNHTLRPFQFKSVPLLK